MDPQSLASAMIISRKHKFVFLKTRRTAGSSLESWLYKYLDSEDTITGSERDGTPRMNCPDGITGHISSEKIRQLFPETASGYSWFCVERNSYQKAVSDWLYHRDIIGDGYAELHLHLANTNISDWDRYSKEKGLQVLQFDSVIKFLALVDVHLKPNSYKKPLNQYYGLHTIQQVGKIFNNEIHQFGYTMP